MTDYHSPTVVTPELPVADISPLERLILGRVFDVPGQRDGRLYFATPSRPQEAFNASAENLKAALEYSRGFESRLSSWVDEALGDEDPQPNEAIEIDVGDMNDAWAVILQDIVRRSSSLDEIVVWTAFTCTRLCQDGFGGQVTRITADAIQSASTGSMLQKFRDADIRDEGSPAGGHETRGQLEAIAAEARWDSFTLLLLIAQWIDRNGQAEQLTDHLHTLASEEAS